MAREMVESKGVEMYRFQTEGETLSGWLLKMGKVKIEDKESHELKEVVQGIIGDEDGQVTTFLMTYDLTRKLWAKHLGRFVVIRYEASKPIPGQEKAMGVFKVTFSADVEKDEAARAAMMEEAGMFAATDGDIPF